MNEVLSSHSDVTQNKYIRVMTITCLTLLLDLPALIVLVATKLIEGQESDINHSYRSWAFIHDGSLSKILQTTAHEWGGDKWQVFNVKWNEWMYVLHAMVFFSIFGTTPESLRRYRSAISCVLESIGLKKKTQATAGASEIMFSSNPPPRRQPAR